MKPPEEVKRELACDWLRKAEGDLRTCRHLLAGGQEYVEGAAFHAQQAAEKYLKAYLVWRQVDFPKTHDIRLLVDLVHAEDQELAAKLSEASYLTPYGVEYRYPGDYPDVSLAEAERCLETASRVREEVRRQLPGDLPD